MKTLRARPGALPISNVGDEGIHLTVSASKDAPKVEMYVARKTAMVVGVTDDDYALTRRGRAGQASRRAHLQRRCDDTTESARRECRRGAVVKRSARS